MTELNRVSMYRIDKASILYSLSNWDYRDFMKYAIVR